jgi:hypothetical protein
MPQLILLPPGQYQDADVGMMLRDDKLWLKKEIEDRVQEAIAGAVDVFKAARLATDRKVQSGVGHC